MTVAALLLCKLKLVVNTERLNVEVVLCLVVHQERVRTWLATAFWLPKTRSKLVFAYIRFCLDPGAFAWVREWCWRDNQMLAWLQSHSSYGDPGRLGICDGSTIWGPKYSELLSSSEVNLSFKLQSNRFDSDHSIKVKTRFCIFRLILAVLIRL